MKTKVLLIILLISGSLTYAQSKLADKFFENFAYVRAIELYQKAYDNGDKSEHVLTRLGDCYYNNSNPIKAAPYYKEALGMDLAKIKPETFYRYSQVLLSLDAENNYEEAAKWLKLYNANRNIEKIELSKPQYYTITNLDINTPGSDFGGYEHNGKLYFASGRKISSTGSDALYDWNEEPFLDILQADVTNNNGVKKIENDIFILADNVNTDYHEASVAITNDGKTIYFTRDNVNKRNRLDYGKDGTTHLKIYRASLDNGNWADIEDLSINGDEFSTGHPALSSDNKTLYFVSDRKNGLGKTDIWKVVINDDGSLGEPENLGPNVNTRHREMFPFVSKNDTLYFSSDGKINNRHGLLDIYKSGILKGDNSKPVNLGTPFNSEADDFAFYIENGEQRIDDTGYFSSNRPGGKGNDDIYSFAAYECKQTLTGILRDCDTQIPLGGANVEILDENKVIKQTIITAEDGSYSVEIDCNKLYSIRGSKKDYNDNNKTMTETNTVHDFTHNLDLCLKSACTDIEIVINDIYFNFDKDDIREDAAYELEKIVTVMRDNPLLVIKIESHTDSRGTKEYNRDLSDRRAKSSRDYLISRNIAPERIESAIGYGEDRLVNECADGVRCSKQKHQDNRRSKFLIVKGKCQN
ncbi:OmpA family protein [Flavobacteriaceae bacterium S0862]|nr:OmpA family protein [Flavobacteriaceae bacterium S0862]